MGKDFATAPTINPLAYILHLSTKVIMNSSGSHTTILCRRNSTSIRRVYLQSLTSRRFYNAHETTAVEEFAIALLCGDVRCDVSLQFYLNKSKRADLYFRCMRGVSYSMETGLDSQSLIGKLCLLSKYCAPVYEISWRDRLGIQGNLSQCNNRNGWMFGKRYFLRNSRISRRHTNF